MPSFSLVLLLHLLFCPAPSPATQRYSTTSPPPSTSSHIVRPLTIFPPRCSPLSNVYSLSHEPAPIVRRKSVNTIYDISNQGMVHGRPWHALQAQAFTMTKAQDQGGRTPGAALRESAYWVFARCPNFVMNLQMDAALVCRMPIASRYISLIDLIALLIFSVPRSDMQPFSLQ